MFIVCLLSSGKLDVAALLALADTTPEQCNNLTALTVESYAYRLWQVGVRMLVVDLDSTKQLN